MTTKKTTPKAKPLTKLQEAKREAAIYASALYQTYDDFDEMFAVLRYIIDDTEKPEFSRYQVRDALKALRTLMITNQSMMMDCAGLEY
jgi:hypothetical protein